MKISEIFDATKREDYRDYGKSCKCSNPFTFQIRFGNFIASPNDLGYPHGYESVEAAESMAEFIKNELSSDEFVALVLRNGDFTEGNGPMIPEKIFKNPDHAHGYVMCNDGIYGSNQYRQIFYGVSIKGTLYCFISYNGYKIKIMEVE